jgi:hypothetical protein
MANGRRDFSRDELTENRISVITAQQKDGAAAGRFRQLRPPDFVLFHAGGGDFRLLASFASNNSIRSGAT